MHLYGLLCQNYGGIGLKKRAVTVTLPAPHNAEIPCPICEGNKCKVCNMSGKLKIKVAPKIPIQRAHIIKYVVDNIHDVASEITRTYGLVPEMNTTEVISVNEGQYEVVQVSSLGGACWIVNRLDELDTPRYFTSRKELDKFKQGWFNE
jgi:ribosomal protein RSM22 (predicted rRNA methylase)